MKDRNFFRILSYIYKQPNDNIKVSSNYKDLLNLKNKKKFILFKSRKNLYELYQIYIFLFKNKIKFKKNFVIFTQIDEVIHGQNIIPEWTGYYCQRGIFYNLLNWLKSFFFNIYYFNNSKFILIERKK
jgi:hypothetical protein